MGCISYRNGLLYTTETNDARGFRQWQEVGRHVKEGAKAITILAPRFIKKHQENGEDGKVILVGFLSVPVFRVEDTEGDPLDYQKIELPELP